MRGLLWFLAVATAAVALALFARYQGGYVLLVTPPWRVEVSLVLFIIALVALFAALYSITRAASTMLRMPATVAAYRERQREQKGMAALRGAWRAFFEGRYGRAEKLAAQAYALDESPGVSALLAARAAHSMRDGDRRDLWLTRAENVPHEDRKANLATRAELLLDDRRYEEARAVLRELDGLAPKHVATLRLQLRAEQGLQNWDEVVRLVRALEKKQALSPEIAAQVRSSAVIESVRRRAMDAEGLEAYWRNLPPAERMQSRIALEVARRFVRLGSCRRVHELVREALQREWDPALVLVLGECRAEDALARLSQAERWLQARPHDAALLLTLARLCEQCELWGKARSYYEASLSEQPSRLAHLELARLVDGHGDPNGAACHFRAAADEALPLEPRG
jgi:HemY protein